MVFVMPIFQALLTTHRGKGMGKQLLRVYQLQRNIWRYFFFFFKIIIQLSVYSLRAESTFFFYPELWISISSLVIMFLLRISRVGASRYYATARLRCLNRNILINNAFVCKLIQILGVNEYSKSCYIQNESRNICRLWSNFSFPSNNVNILIFQCLWSALYPINILCKNAFKRERPRCVGPRYLLINKIII